MSRRAARADLEKRLREAERVLHYIAGVAAHHAARRAEAEEFEVKDDADGEATIALALAGRVADEALARIATLTGDETTGASSPTGEPRARGRGERAADAEPAANDADGEARACDHDRHRPEFSSEAACGLEADEVLRRWPPFEGRCATCGAWVVVFASSTHEVLASW